MSLILRETEVGNARGEAGRPRVASRAGAGSAGLAESFRHRTRGHAALAGVLLAAPFTLLALVLCVVIRPGLLPSAGLILGANVGVFCTTIAAFAVVDRLRRSRAPAGESRPRWVKQEAPAPWEARG